MRSVGNNICTILNSYLVNVNNMTTDKVAFAFCDIFRQIIYTVGLGRMDT